jgi:hypothetical protein
LENGEDMGEPATLCSIALFGLSELRPRQSAKA